jgi:hypothetical protein
MVVLYEVSGTNVLPEQKRSTTTGSGGSSRMMPSEDVLLIPTGATVNLLINGPGIDSLVGQHLLSRPGVPEWIRRSAMIRRMMRGRMRVDGRKSCVGVCGRRRRRFVSGSIVIIVVVYDLLCRVHLVRSSVLIIVAIVHRPVVTLHLCDVIGR